MHQSQDMTTNRRPVNLNLLRFRFPVVAVLSILHRFSGVILLFTGLLTCWLLSISVQSETGFARAVALIGSPPMRWLGIVLVWAFTHHLLAGIRYLLIDLDFGVERRQARISAWIVNLTALLVTGGYVTGVVL